jgi:phage-related holin
MRNWFVRSLDVIIIYLVTYFAPTFSVMMGISFLVLIDFVTGMVAAYKRGEAITSRKMRPTITKGMGYMLAILAAHIFQKHFLPTIEVMKIVSGLIAFIELKSLDENLKDMTGKSLFKQFFKEGK